MRDYKSLCVAVTICTPFDRKLNFYRASICEGGLGSRNYVRPSVRPSHAWIVTKLNDALQIFLYHTKGQSLCYSDTKSGCSATPPSLWNLRSKWPTPFEKCRIRLISAHKVSTIGDSEKSSITTNIDEYGAKSNSSIYNSLKLTPPHLKSLIELVRSLCHSWATCSTMYWTDRPTDRQIIHGKFDDYSPLPSNESDAV